MINIPINTINVHEMKEIMETNPNTCLIDVREDYEWQTLRIKGAIHIPKDELTNAITTTLPDLQQPIYLHCKSGVRSLHAAQLLNEMGYENVYSVAGGISEWAANNYPTIS